MYLEKCTEKSTAVEQCWTWHNHMYTDIHTCKYYYCEYTDRKYDL